QRRDPRPVGRDQVGRPKPQRQRQTRLVHHRSRGHRRLPTAGLALPEMPTMLSADRASAARRAGEPVRPPRRKQVRTTRQLVWKQALELDYRTRKARTRHLTTVRPGPDGPNRITMSSALGEFLFAWEPTFWREGRTRVARVARISSSADAGSVCSSSSKTWPYVLSAIDGEWPAWRATSTMLLRSAIRSDTNEWRRSYGTAMNLFRSACGGSCRLRGCARAVPAIAAGRSARRARGDYPRAPLRSRALRRHPWCGSRSSSARA